MFDSLSFKKDLSWDDVFDVWRKNEADHPGWIHTATEVKGWPDWETWRRYQASHLKLAERVWKLYEFTDPGKQIPEMLVGPFGSWQDQLPEPMRLQATFHDFIAERLDWVKGYNRIPDMMQHFPSPTQMMGLYLEDRDQLVCFEGSHRAAAVALAATEGKIVDFGSQKPLIAVATISGDTHELFARALEIGSENPERRSEV